MVVSNARCFGEGVDVPAIDAAAFVDPRESVIDIVQAIGRTMRKSPGKTVGTIIVPVAIAEGEDPRGTLLKSAWAQVWKVLEAMRSHDDRLDEELRAMARALASPRKTARVRPPSQLIFELPFRVDDSFSRAFVLRVVEMTSTSFERGLEEFAACVEERRRDPELADWKAPLIPTLYKSPSGFPIGLWCSAQRSERTKGILRADRIAALDDLAFVWNHEAWSFDHTLKEFDAYVEARRADPRVPAWLAPLVPQDHITSTGTRLGRWCSWLRMRRMKDRLSSQRIAGLDRHGFVWEPVDWSFDHALMEFETCVRERLSDPGIPDWRAPLISQDYIAPSGFDLGTWCESRRRDHDQNRLHPERVERLEAAGFVWDRKKWQFENALKEFEAYVVERRRDPDLEDWEAPLIRVDHVTPSGYALGEWCFRLRNGRKHRLAEQRKGELDALGLVSDLDAYLERHAGHAPDKAFQYRGRRHATSQSG